MNYLANLVGIPVHYDCIQIGRTLGIGPPLPQWRTTEHGILLSLLYSMGPFSRYKLLIDIFDIWVLVPLFYVRLFKEMFAVEAFIILVY